VYVNLFCVTLLKTNVLIRYWKTELTNICRKTFKQKEKEESNWEE